MAVIKAFRIKERNVQSGNAASEVTATLLPQAQPPRLSIIQNTDELMLTREQVDELREALGLIDWPV